MVNLLKGHFLFIDLSLHSWQELKKSLWVKKHIEFGILVLDGWVLQLRYLSLEVLLSQQLVLGCWWIYCYFSKTPKRTPAWSTIFSNDGSVFCFFRNRSWKNCLNGQLYVCFFFCVYYTFPFLDLNIIIKKTSKFYIS